MLGQEIEAGTHWLRVPIPMPHPATGPKTTAPATAIKAADWLLLAGAQRMAVRAALAVAACAREIERAERSWIPQRIRMTMIIMGVAGAAIVAVSAG